MANQEHLNLLKYGVSIWNQWKKMDPQVQPNLSRANLSGANLRGADLKGADLSEADLRGADLSEADLRRASLFGANLGEAYFSYSRETDLYDPHIKGTNLRGADLSEADLRKAVLVGTNLTGATLTSCKVYGISVWDVQLQGARQDNLVITLSDQPIVTVDNLKVAQFIYLLLNNQEVRDVIDTITSKVVLILGRFTLERKAVLDALRNELRKYNYLG